MEIQIQTLPEVAQVVHVLFPQQNKPAVDFCYKLNTVISETNVNSINIA